LANKSLIATKIPVLVAVQSSHQMDMRLAKSFRDITAQSATGMIALVEVNDTHRAPKGRHCLPPSQ
jgi:hypothetical protein